MYFFRPTLACFLVGLPLAMSALAQTMPSSVTLTSSINPSKFGVPITLITTLTPATATGKVTFYSGTNVLGTLPLTAGQAVLNSSLLPSGPQSLYAYYSGNASLAPSKSSPLKQTVNTITGYGFHPPTNYAAECYSIAVSDFNSDGIPDLALASYFTDSVSVLLGKGDGTFHPPITSPYEDAYSPVSLVVADFNGDGNLDIAEATYSTQYITVLLGNGDGSFRSPEPLTAGLTFPYSIAVGDFNGDGVADLVVSDNEDPANADVFLGNGDGTSQPPQSYAAGALVAVADFNGDGLADLVIGDFSSNVINVQLGNGNGTFQPPLVSAANFGTPYYSMAIGDFNGDGMPDVVTANGYVVSVLIGNGDGTFQNPTNYSAAGIFLVVQDFTGSGRADLALAGNPTETEGNQSVSMLLSTPALESFIALTSTPNPSSFGQAVTISATVSPLNATGIVSFYDQNGGLGDVAIQGGVATLKLSTLPTGTDSLRAFYDGDATYPKSLSLVYTQTVNKVATLTGLTSSPDPSQSGQTVTFTATVTPKNAVGEVTFYLDSAILAVTPLTRGTASVISSTLSTGTHTVIAVYEGDKNYSPSRAPTRLQKVTAPGIVDASTKELTHAVDVVGHFVSTTDQYICTLLPNSI